MGKDALRCAAGTAVAAAALLLAACGGSGDDGTPRAPAPATPRPQPAGPLQIGVAKGRLGDATTASPERGLDRLSPGGVLRPSDARPRPGQREGVGAGASCADVGLTPSSANVDAVAQATLCLLNGERQDRGLGALTINATLGRAAAEYSRDMVAHSYFSHTGRDGSDSTARLRAAGYIPDDRTGSQWQVGENLAWGSGPLATPAAIVQAWMNSPGHRANILTPGYREIGIGIAMGTPQGGDGPGATYTTEFGALDGGGRRPARVAQAGAGSRRCARGARRGTVRGARASSRRSARARARC